jgi:hypothetical protein
MNHRKFEAENQLGHYRRRFRRAFRYQYNLSTEQEDIYSFAHQQCGDWHVHNGDGLPVCRLRDKNGRHIGVVLGIAVGPVGLISETSPFIPLDSTQQQFWRKFEEYIVDVAGRYAFILVRGSQTRMYVDPVGMIGAVYNKEDRYVASSPLLAIKRPVRQNPKFDPTIIEKHAGKYSLFHTVDVGVKRLMPNHYLDLSNFKEKRFWPKTENFVEPGQTRMSIYSEIAARTQFNVNAISPNFTCAMPISGGQDSRLLLALAKSNLHNIEQIYTHINNYATRIDDAIGSALCETIGVDHETHDKRQYSMKRWETVLTNQMFNVSLGYPSTAPKEYLNGVIKGVEDGAVILRGHQTDLLRAVYVFAPEDRWREAEWQLERMLIVPRPMFNTDVIDTFKEDFLNWQSTLPKNALKKAADFMFLEVYYNSTVGTIFPALWRNFYVSPYNSRRLISLSLSFPEVVRRNSEPVFDIIQRFAPEISKIPFDHEIGAEISLLSDQEHVEKITKKRLSSTTKRLHAIDLEIR